jgi:hypothetical protein
LKNYINNQNLLLLVDKHFAPFISKKKYNVLYVQPSKLISYNRLDLAIKILYLQMSEYKDVLFAKELYIKHLNAFSLGVFVEPGNIEKNSVARYLEDFEVIYRSILDDGIDETRSIIPLSIGGTISNGSHRVSSSYMAKKNVPTVSLNIPQDQYDYKFFSQRGMSEQDIETSVTKFIELADNCYIALIWPSAQGQQNELDKLIPNIIYQNNISLNHSGAHNLLSQVYYDEDWLGERAENYPGVKNKLVECFKTFDDLRVIAFQEESLDKVLLLKKKIRQAFSIGKHSVHISDTKEEAIRIARILFNENSIHFLNYGNANKYSATHQKLERFKKFIEKNNFEVESVVLDSSIVLSLYGIRECSDIDYLSVHTDIKYHDELIEDHTEELDFHQEGKNTMIFNQSFYFYYDDLKFISFPQIYKMKKNRLEQKDKNDLALMKASIEGNLIRTGIATVKQKFYFLTVKLRLKVMKYLKAVGLYEIVRYVYRILKSKH